MPPEDRNLITVRGLPGCLLSVFVAVGSLGGVLYLATVLADSFRR